VRFHAPRAYRYDIAYPAERRAMLNRYGWQVIGVAVVIGHYAYCLKWARAT
jgi:hypothetical protein